MHASTSTIKRLPRYIDVSYMCELPVCYIYGTEGAYYWWSTINEARSIGHTYPTKISACHAAIEWAVAECLEVAILAGTGVDKKAANYMNDLIHVHLV